MQSFSLSLNPSDTGFEGDTAKQLPTQCFNLGLSQ